MKPTLGYDYLTLRAMPADRRFPLGVKRALRELDRAVGVALLEGYQIVSNVSIPIVSVSASLMSARYVDAVIVRRPRHPSE